MPKLNTIFCVTFFLVYLDIINDSVILVKLSPIITISAIAIVASLPVLPIAIPTSAALITGASLIPSPTKATLSCSFVFAAISNTSSKVNNLALLSPVTSVIVSPSLWVNFVTPFFISIYF